ncbi:unnamed protein product [Linum trigynum]|uniref:Uncharacterized protein n=1 Tax=Linum trigynum TaxID=586398 RepID=A0AAV2D3Y8_9ROSI
MIHLSNHHLAKTARPELLPPHHHTTPLPNNLHLIHLSPNLHHRFFFKHESPHKHVLVQRLSSKKRPPTFGAKPRRVQRRYYSFLRDEKSFRRTGVTVASPWGEIGPKHFVIRRDGCTETDPSE